MELLVKGEEEDKKVFKKRLSEQKSMMSDKLLSDEQKSLLKEYQDKEKVAYEKWLDAVLGRKK